MRSIEVARLTLADWDVEAGTLLLRGTKNRRDHLVQLHPATVDYLHRWIQIRGEAPGALFTPVRGRTLRHLSEETVQNRVQFLGHAAGITHFGSHDFRRTFATELLRTHDAPLVGKLLNHKKLTSTMVYDLASEDEQRAAVASIELPKVSPHHHSDGTEGGAA
jgi:integrase